MSYQLSDIDQTIIDLFFSEHGKEKAFRLLVDTYRERLYWHIRRLVVQHDDADDVLQNVFVKAWRGLEQFKQASSLYTWLYRIASNESLTYLDKQKRHRSLSLSEHENGLSNTLKAEKGFNPNKAEWKLQLAIQELPEKQRLVFTLRYFDEMPYEKMAEVLDTSAGALKASYHHAAKKIAAYLTQH
ncbi:MAG: RNA polymerase sigma factor [Chitinophagaceae bacterium]